MLWISLLWTLLLSAIAFCHDSAMSPPAANIATIVAVTVAATSSIEPTPTPSTIVDILSSQPQYSYFLRHLQRQGMIPKLNSLVNITLLAPINSAFIDNQIECNLNQNQLLRYIVNQKFRIGHLDKHQVIFDTLYELNGKPYPISITPDFETYEYVVDDIAHIVDGDVYAKHQHSFIQGIDKMLPMKPSLCQVLLNNDQDSDFSFIKKLFKSLFEDDDDDDDDDDSGMFEIIRHNNAGNILKGGKKKKKNKKKNHSPTKEPPLPKSCEEYLSGFQTIFVPTDSFVENSLTELQMKYYSSSYFDDNTPNYFTTEEAEKEIKQDIVKLLDNLLIKDLIAGVNGTNSTRDTKAGNKLKINLDNSSHIIVNKKIKSTSSQVLSNGVIHTFGFQIGSFFEDLHITPVEIIPRKALYAMHFSNFVKELDFRSLDNLVDGSSEKQTLFIDIASRDDIDDEEDDADDKVNFLATLKFSSKQELLYQFANEPIPAPSKDHMHRLYTSKLCSKKKLGGCFKLKFSSSTTKGIQKVTINDDTEIIHGPINIGNDTILYIANGEVSPPSNFKHALGDLISSGSIHRHRDTIQIDEQGCLKTLAYLGQFNLMTLEDNGEGYTVFLPCGYKRFNSQSKATAPGIWGELGLVLDYLEANPKLFQSVLRANFLEDDIYSDFGLYEKQHRRTLKNLNGNNVVVEGGMGSNINDTVNILKYNKSEIPIPLNSDVLFSQGVIHVINELLLPDQFSIPLEGLIQATMDSNFPNHSFDELLKIFPKIRHSLGLDGSGKKSTYSLLIPTPESIKDFNITTSFKDLLNFIEFHMIPNEELSKVLNCINGQGNQNHHNNDTNDTIIKTNLTQAGLTCNHIPESRKTFLQFHKIENSSPASLKSYNKDQQVRLISHGCTSMYKGDNNTENLSCVFLIEKPLNLEWVNGPNKGGDDFLHIHIGFISVGVGIILGLILFGGVMLSFIFCLGGGLGRRKNKNDTNQILFPRPDSGFMSVLTDDDNEFYPYDGGYETDVDGLRVESEPLLPTFVKKKKKIRRKDYGSTNTMPSNLRTNSSNIIPRSININKNSSNRDRNIPPGYSQF
ncbi:uncharacterized protein J8A68_002065 [[Candida] subhashii]|uniref:FAS1 domain-containing protein n=1 Tax=[Candida] subhashii TaxID=561895 RepID=A0A8J5QJT5_9ASCO|nr:uncharacterized protein J8A68_002065 [[Candida] subhashii]KAG7664392.1 hypothetical protein J8A68_002065 [[Candida] subhashii]